MPPIGDGGTQPAPPGPGGVAFDPSGFSGLGARVVATLVTKVDANGTRRPVPGVQWTSIRRAEGPSPSSALFRARQGAFGGAQDYRRFDAYLGLGRPAGGLATDDRVAVAALTAGGAFRWLFDGFVSIPHVGVSPREQEAQFQAQGVEVRCFDAGLGGAIWRDADDPESAEADVRTTMEPRFNPRGAANATGADFDSGGDGRKYPVFLDPAADLDDGRRRPWTLEMAARYLLYAPPEGRTAPDETYLELPDSEYIKALLKAKNPETGGDDDIALRDWSPATSPWPEALQDLIRPYGFAFDWFLIDDDGAPRLRIRLFRVADAVPVKDLKLQPTGAPPVPIIPAQNDISTLRVERDTARLVNEWEVVGNEAEHQISVVLAPGFRVAAGDATPANLKLWRREKSEATVDADKYRLFVADEAGEGYWDFDTGAWNTGDPLDLDDVLGLTEDDRRAYVRRRRPGRETLVSEDDEGKAHRVELAVLTGYSGHAPAVWDRTGTARPVAGGWRLKRDRLGVRLTCSDPNRWHIGEYDDIADMRGGVLPLVEWLNDPARRVHLLLTTVIEGDQGQLAEAGRRATSPTRFAVARRIDRRDRFRIAFVHASSRLGTPDEEPALDDGPAQLAEAAARRKAWESAPQSGTVVVPRLTTAYELGDRIRRLAGRGVSFDGGRPADGQDPIYPRVVALQWRHEAQAVDTTLSLADHRGEPAWSESPAAAEMPGGGGDGG